MPEESSESSPCKAKAASPPWWRNEDWLAVATGSLLIGGVLVGGRLTAPAFAWSDGGTLAGTVLAGSNVAAAGLLGLVCWILSLAGLALAGVRVAGVLAGFPVVFGLAWLAQVLAGQAKVNALGLEYVLFALGLGLLVSQVMGVPAWLREAVRTEYYIKSGLVILGAGILFGEILQAGFLGMIQALLVVSAVWGFGFWLCRRWRVDDEFGAMLATAVAICGVSAAIAACGAIQGDRKKLSYVTSLVLIVAVPMMVLMPWAVKALGIPELVGGAWLGGTLDTSGSVVAAGALISEGAMKVGVIVKFSQNVLIGVAAFALSLWWAVRQREPGQPRPRVAVIWERFPKFVLGFLGASVVFSFLLEGGTVAACKPTLGALRTTWFALAFVCIGLETRFADLLRLEDGRPALAFLGAQAFNVVWTLILAYLLFGGLLVAPPQLQ
ncbi:MAG: putative sulfate exporter family transporter [Verrucomicrobia bacterium]|nr:putative sulfate exporter family transporter [Verrucomicrobiota bacterium]